MLFTKPSYEEIRLPFILDDDPEDRKSGMISVEAYGNVLGYAKYCYASYCLKNPLMYDNGDYEQMIDLLKNSAGKTIKVILKSKKGMPKGFKIDVNSLAEAYNDERFKSLELVGWGLNNKSFKELTSEQY